MAFSIPYDTLSKEISKTKAFSDEKMPNALLRLEGNQCDFVFSNGRKTYVSRLDVDVEGEQENFQTVFNLEKFDAIMKRAAPVSGYIDTNSVVMDYTNKTLRFEIEKVFTSGANEEIEGKVAARMNCSLVCYDVSDNRAFDMLARVDVDQVLNAEGANVSKEWLSEILSDLANEVNKEKSSTLFFSAQADQAFSVSTGTSHVSEIKMLGNLPENCGFSVHVDVAKELIEILGYNYSEDLSIGVVTGVGKFCTIVSPEERNAVVFNMAPAIKQEIVSYEVYTGAAYQDVLLRVNRMAAHNALQFIAAEKNEKSVMRIEKDNVLGEFFINISGVGESEIDIPVSGTKFGESIGGEEGALKIECNIVVRTIANLVSNCKMEWIDILLHRVRDGEYFIKIEDLTDKVDDEGRVTARARYYTNAFADTK